MPVKNQRYVPLANALVQIVVDLRSCGYPAALVERVVLDRICGAFERYSDFNVEFFRRYVRRLVG